MLNQYIFSFCIVLVSDRREFVIVAVALSFIHSPALWHSGNLALWHTVYTHQSYKTLLQKH